MSLLNNIRWGMVEAIGLAPLSLLWAMALANGLPSGPHGQLMAALSALWLATLAAQQGWVAATIQRIRTRKRRGPALTTGVMAVTIGWLVVSVLCYTGFGWAKDRFLLGLSGDNLPWLLGILLGRLWMGIFGAVARASDNFRTWTLTRLLQSVGNLVLVVVAIGWVQASVRSVFIGLMISQWLATGFVAISVIPGVQLGSSSFDQIKKSVVFAWLSAGNVIASEVHERMDLFFLAWWTQDPAVVGTYAIAVAIINRVRSLPLAIAAALHPSAAGASPEQAASLAARSCRLAFTAAGGVGLVIVAISPFVIGPMFTHTYQGAYQAIAALFPGTVMASVWLVLLRYFQAIDAQTTTVQTQLLGLASNLGCNALLIPSLGFVGAAIASSISYSVQSGVLLRAFSRRTQTPINKLLVAQWTDFRGTS